MRFAKLTWSGILYVTLGVTAFYWDGGRYFFCTFMSCPF